MDPVYKDDLERELGDNRHDRDPASGFGRGRRAGLVDGGDDCALSYPCIQNWMEIMRKLSSDR